ncbi:helix-turn-helix domain-containing protein [Neptuniibacter sp. QD37_11]|uniref:helix-turn-helix domain-containing protein n=1 Tax=Neptuniibacter sp. QD37_11 TaxID=3398209 RepID=UPI0039F50F26
MTNAPYFQISTPAQLGEIIRKTRKAQGLRQDDFAKQLDTSHVTLKHIEKGAQGSQIGLYSSALKALGIKLFFRKSSDLERTFRLNCLNDCGSFLLNDRKRRAFRQDVIAKNIGASHVTVRDVESAKPTVKVETYFNIAAVLGCQILVNQEIGLLCFDQPNLRSMNDPINQTFAKAG